MNKKIILLILSIIIVIAIITGVILVNSNNKFSLASDSSYLVTTDEIINTYLDDGGSHTNSYYEIDFNNNTVTMRKDEYKGFEGYVYQGKLIYTKNLTDSEANQLKELLDTVISNTDASTEGNILVLNYYTISTKDVKDIKLYDVDLDRFLELVKQ